MKTKHQVSVKWLSLTTCDTTTVAIVNEAVSASIHLLNDIKSPKTIQVYIDEIKNDINDEDELNMLGSCRASGINEDKSPGLVTITINPVFLNHNQLVHTVFHEMVHAKQLFEGRLLYSRIKSGNDGILRLWNKRAFSTRSMKYELWPWEVEAEDIAFELDRSIDVDSLIDDAIDLAEEVDRINKLQAQRA